MIPRMRERRLSSTLRKPVVAVNTILVALVIGAGFWAYQMVNGTSAAGATANSGRANQSPVVTRDVVESVSASGTVASSDVQAANFTTSGTVTNIYVKLGDHVTKGETLAKISCTPSNEALQTAEDNLTVAQDSLTRAQDSQDTSSIDTAQTQVDTAKDNVTSAKATVAGCTLKAPIAGTIIAQNGVVGATSTSSGSGSGGSGSSSFGGSGSGSGGSTSSSSNGFMQIADLTQMEVDTDFAEADTAKLKVGMSATITWNALSGATATGEVASIDPTATTSNNVVSYGVTVKLTSLPDGIRIGQSTTVDVTIDQAQGVLAVPNAAVTTIGGASTVEIAGQTTRVRVTIGLVGDSYTEIKSGLTAGQMVVLPAATTSTTSTTNTNPFTGGGGLGGLGGGGGGGVVNRTGR